MNNGVTVREYPRIDLETNVKQPPYLVACGFNCTDEGNAQRLIFYYGDVIRYCHDVKSWFLYDDIKWNLDKNKQIYERAKDVVRLIHFESALVDPDDPERKSKQRDLIRWAFASEAKVKLRDMIELAQTDLRIIIDRDELNANSHIINFPNGTMDLERREFREHRKEDMLSMVTRVPYNPFKKSRYFFSTLKMALPTDEAINLQRREGLALEGTTQNKELILTYGKPYSCKSSITQAFYEALGDYAMYFDPAILAKNRHGIASNAARPELVVLEDVLVAWTEETPEGMVFDDATIKALTSSGQKPTRGLFEKQRVIRYKMTMAIETNGPPNIDIDDDWQREATLERIGVTPFLYTVPPDKRDKEVLKRLTGDEDELTVALAWGIQGYFDRLDCGLVETENTLDSVEKFKVDINPIAPFIESEVVFDDGTQDGAIHSEVYTVVSDLYARFKEYADRDLSERFKNARSFNAQFKRAVGYYAKKAGVEVADKRRNFGVIWTNLRLKEVVDDTPEDCENLADGGLSVANGAKCSKTPTLVYLNNIDFSHEGLYQTPYFATPEGIRLPFPIVKIGLGASLLESENDTDVSK